MSSNENKPAQLSAITVQKQQKQQQQQQQQNNDSDVIRTVLRMWQNRQTKTKNKQTNQLGCLLGLGRVINKYRTNIVIGGFSREPRNMMFDRGTALEVLIGPLGSVYNLVV